MLLQRPHDRLEPWKPHRFINDQGVVIEPAYSETIKLVQSVVEVITRARISSSVMMRHPKYKQKRNTK